VLLKDLSAKQQNQLVVLYEKKSELESDLKKKENDLEIQKILVKEKDTKIIKLTKEYKEQLELSEKLDKEAVQNDTSYLTNKLATLESKMVGLKKEIAFFKSESE
jgi:superfamily II DNA or RNA helicase